MQILWYALTLKLLDLAYSYWWVLALLILTIVNILFISWISTRAK